MESTTPDPQQIQVRLESSIWHVRGVTHGPSSCCTSHYVATNERWECHRWDARLALAKLRPDGFFSLEAKEKPGTVVTKPFKLEGRTLHVNVDAQAGWVQIELLDETGREISGFSGRAAKQYRGAGELGLTPQWKSFGDLSRRTGTTVRLRFTLRKAELYAFEFTQ